MFCCISFPKKLFPCGSLAKTFYCPLNLNILNQGLLHRIAGPLTERVRCADRHSDRAHQVKSSHFFLLYKWLAVSSFISSKKYSQWMQSYGRSVRENSNLDGWQISIFEMAKFSVPSIVPLDSGADSSYDTRKSKRRNLSLRFVSAVDAEHIIQNAHRYVFAVTVYMCLQNPAEIIPSVSIHQSPPFRTPINDSIVLIPQNHSIMLQTVKHTNMSRPGHDGTRKILSLNKRGRNPSIHRMTTCARTPLFKIFWHEICPSRIISIN
jgi:hypothetical protein